MNCGLARKILDQTHLLKGSYPETAIIPINSSNTHNIAGFDLFIKLYGYFCLINLMFGCLLHIQDFSSYRYFHFDFFRSSACFFFQLILVQL